jgi:cytochrome c-type biogenesis protein CcmH/NrfG
MKKVANLFIIASCLAFNYGALAQNDNAMRWLEMQQYNKAKAAFISNLRTNNSAANWYFLGKIYSIQHNSDSARLCFSKVALADPKSNLGPVGQALIENMEGNKAQSLLSLDKVQKTATSAKDVTSLIEIADARYMAGDTIKWVDVLTTASNVDRKNPKPYIAAGKIYSKLGENYLQVSFNGLASGRFEQAIYYDAANSEAQTYLANIYVRARNYQDAETILNKVIAKDSLYIPALKDLGELEYTLGKFDNASKAYGKYIQIAEYSSKDLSRYITILYFNKEYAKANTLITTVLKTDPSNPVMLRLKGYTSFELESFPEGLDAMNRFFALRSAKDTSKIIATDYEYYGKLLSRSGSDSLGIINLKKSLEMDSTKTDLLKDIALAYEKQKKNLQAVEYYEKFIAARNNNVASSIYFSIGKDMLVLANEVAGTADSVQGPVYLVHADSAFSKVIATAPNSPLGYLWRARARAGLDPTTTLGLAKDDYQKALEILELRNDNQKYKNDLMESYRYMGYYNYLKYDAAKTAKDDVAREQAKTDSMAFWQKVLGLDPENDIAKKAIAALK